MADLLRASNVDIQKAAANQEYLRQAQLQDAATEASRQRSLQTTPIRQNINAQRASVNRSAANTEATTASLLEQAAQTASQKRSSLANALRVARKPAPRASEGR